MIQDTVRYQLNGTVADDEFAAIFLPTGHTFYSAGGNQVYTVALFHQLRCLDVVRRAYVHRGEFSPLKAHCLNYLRQSILCQADTRLESTRGPYQSQYVFYAIRFPFSALMRSVTSVVQFSSDYICRDWRPLYAAVNEHGQ